jgi:hypothetical protein
MDTKKIKDILSTIVDKVSRKPTDEELKKNPLNVNTAAGAISKHRQNQKKAIDKIFE